VRVVVQKEPLRRLLRWAQGALFAVALASLGYCGFAVADAWNFQRRENSDFDRLLNTRRTMSRDVPPAAASGLIGRLEIPRLRLSVVVVEGVGRTVLRRAVGHIPGTALPGQPGNVGLSGHRDTFFRPLKDLRIGDEIRFSTLSGDFAYRVESLKIVGPNGVEVLASSHENVLTMVTCYPFYYVGAAPMRFVARALQLTPQASAGLTVE
jgi:sortase A